MTAFPPTSSTYHTRCPAVKATMGERLQDRAFRRVHAAAFLENPFGLWYGFEHATGSASGDQAAEEDR